VLAVAGTALIVEALFGAFGLIPEERKAPFEASSSGITPLGSISFYSSWPGY
jgi:hypothetical protein